MCLSQHSIQPVVGTQSKQVVAEGTMCLHKDRTVLMYLGHEVHVQVFIRAHIHLFHERCNLIRLRPASRFNLHEASTSDIRTSSVSHVSKHERQTSSPPKCMKSSGKMPLRLEEPIISLKSPSSSVNVNGLDGSNGTLHGAAYCGGHLLEHFWA